MWRALCSLLLLLPLMLGCGEEEAITPPNLAADVEALRLVMIQDPAHQPLEEMERVAQDRPYEAARLLRTGVIPAAERQLARAEAVSVRTDEGGQLKRRLARAYRDRVGALRDYREVLEDGARDPDALMAALRAQSSADRAVLEHALACSFYGPEDTLRKGMQAFVERTGADELIVTAPIHDPAARLRSFELAAAAAA